MNKGIRSRSLRLYAVVSYILSALAVVRAADSTNAGLAVIREDNAIILQWASDTVQLEATPALGTAAAWERIANPVQLLDGKQSVRLALADTARFFRLRAGSGPALRVELNTAGTVLVSWPNTGQPYLLEVADALTGSAWKEAGRAPVLSGGRYTLEVNTATTTKFFRLRGADQTPAIVIALNLATDTGVSASDRITQRATITGSVSSQDGLSQLRAGFDDRPVDQYSALTDLLDADGGFTMSPTRLDQLNGGLLKDGSHTLHVIAEGVTGKRLGAGDLTFELDTTPPSAVLEPANGQRDVLPTEFIVARFNEPVVLTSPDHGLNPATLTVGTFGSALPGRLVNDQTGTRLSFIPAQELPGNTAFDVTLIATNVFDRAGNQAVVPTQHSTFRTSNSEGIPGTSLTGWVFDASRNVQGGESPLTGATVRILNGSSATAVTDANGKFVLSEIPGGKLLIEVDGHAVRTDPGAFYPTVSKLFEAIPGVSTIIDAPIYLPLVRDSAFVQLSTNAPTMVANSAQLPGWTLEVPPQAIQRRDGTMATRISISPVPPDRLPAPLPSGINPAAVITIQTEGGADVFSEPVPLTAPNLENLPPGAKTVLWDFDHARGEFVPVATATVSADGKTVSTDPGQGVLRPGWHFIREFFDDFIQVLTTETPKKKNQKAIDEYKKRRLAVQLDLAALGADAAGLYPPASLIAAGAGAAAGALRDVVVEGNGLNSASRDTVLLGIQAGGDQAGKQAAEAAYRSSRNLASREFAEAAQDLGLLSKTLKGTAGVFTFLSALDDLNTLKEDLAAAKKALKDPPGDLSDQLLDSMSNLELAATDLSDTLISGLVQYLNGLGDAFSMVAIYEAGLPSAPPTAPDLVQLRVLSASGEKQFLGAARSMAAVPPKVDAFLARAATLQPLLAKETDNRIYYRFSPSVGLASPESSSTLNSTIGEIRLSLRAGASGILTAVEPIRGLVGSARVGIPAVIPPGQVSFREPPLLLESSETEDLDGNGLPDDIDTVLGHPTGAQVAALKNGLPPEGAGIAPLGVIGRLSQRTSIATNVFFSNAYSDLIAGDRVLYGIGGSNVLEVIDISRPSSPIKVGRVRSAGTFIASRGAARGHRVAITGFGARIFDVSDPRQPREVQSIDYTIAGTDRVNPVLGPNHIVIPKKNDLISYDLDTGQPVSTLSLAALGVPITMELNGDVIYVLTYQEPPNLQFSVTTVRFDSNGQLTFIGEVRPFFWSTLSLRSPFGLAISDSAAFVGAWLISIDPFAPGFGAIDILDPAHPTVLGTPSTNHITGAALLASDNAGHLLATVAASPQNQILDVYDVSDPSKTDKRIYSIPLEQPAYAPHFTGGLAVFNTEAYTYIARVTPIDIQKKPPVIQDVVLQTGSIAVEGRHVGVHVTVTDDAQVTRVELLLQGDNVVASDGSFPFDLDFLPPASLPDRQSLELTVRATDSGGNRSEKTVTLTYQAKPPRVLNVVPPLGFSTKLPLTNGLIVFDKPMNRDNVTAADFDLRTSGADGKFNTPDDGHVQLASAVFSSDNTQVYLDFGKPLDVGHYMLTAPSAFLTDRGGNALDGEFNGSFPSGNQIAGGDFTTTFDVQHVPEFSAKAIPFRAFPTDVREYRNFDISSGASPLLVTDITGDGRIDFVRAVFSNSQDTNGFHAVVVTRQNSDGSFANPVTYDAPGNVVQIVSGDLNGDGLADLVTVHFNSAAVGFPARPQPLELNALLGRPAGDFGTALSIDTQGLTNTSPGSLFVADFTGDGRSDIVQFLPDVSVSDFTTGTSTNVVPARVLVYPNLGNANFGPPVLTSLVPARRDFLVFRTTAVAADFNRDGKMDLLVPGDGVLADSVTLLSAGDGTFNAVPNKSFNDSDRLAAADFTADGWPDVIFGNQFYRGKGDGSFEQVKNAGLAENGVTKFNFAGSSEIVADFNRDGRVDFAALVPDANREYSQIGVFTNKADGTFGLDRKIGLGGASPNRLYTAADVDGDGWSDLVTAVGEGTDSPFQAAVLFANADGAFPITPRATGFSRLGAGELSLLADVNGDGRPDVLSYSRNPNPQPIVAVLPSTPDGFGIVTTNAIGVNDPSFFIRALGAGDFDGDGKADVVASQAADQFGFVETNVVYLLRGNGDATFRTGEPIPRIKSLVGVADMTGDGKPDLISLQGEAGFGAVLAVFPSKGDGTFADPIISRDSKFSFFGSLLLGDFNNDGRLDLVARGSSTLGVWLNDGSGRFTLAGTAANLPSSWDLQNIGDFDNDGHLDVLVNDRSGDIPDYRLLLLLGDGTGKLSAPRFAAQFPGTYNSIAKVADVNGDGSLDLVTPGRFPQDFMEARVILGNGDGTFQPSISFFGADNGSTSSVFTGDFNGDGRIDLLVGESVLLQQKPKVP